jgi:hypothetical protein
MCSKTQTACDTRLNRFVTPATDRTVLVSSLRALKYVCIDCELNRDSFHDGYMQMLNNCMLQFAEDRYALEVCHVQLIEVVESAFPHCASTL